MSRSIHIHIHRARDAFEESKHPRASSGKFGSGGSGNASGSELAERHTAHAAKYAAARKKAVAAGNSKAALEASKQENYHLQQAKEAKEKK